ncbi:MAG: YkgJ family cysteine cluster protein [Phycisphaerae bacterium]|jgi:lysine-N-methylase
MTAIDVHLPVYQNFDCHGCGNCCRNMVVNVTDEERRRILDAGWAERLGGRELFVAYRFRGRQLCRLTHQPDGACVFLGEDGRCRLHAETGLHVKPLTCRLYPFVLGPGAGIVGLDLRADCPSVAGNRGRSMSLHRAEIAALVRETRTRPMRSPPEWAGGRGLTDDEFKALAAAFTGLLAHQRLGLRDRLRAGARLLDLLYVARLHKVRGERFVELLHMLTQAVVAETFEAPSPPAVPARAGKLFRQWLFLHAIADDPADLALRGFQRYRRSWARYRQSRAFAAGVGPVPAVRPHWPAVTFEALSRIEPADDALLEPLLRSMRVKLDAHAFCGPGYYGRDALRGLTALWLLPAVSGWLGRLAAAKAGRERLAREDVLDGLRQAHHTFGVSPVFSRLSERLRLHAFARPGVPGALLAAYGP